jgi:hypothetical protein
MQVLGPIIRLAVIVFHSGSHRWSAIRALFQGFLELYDISVDMGIEFGYPPRGGMYGYPMH